jgi:hypothetical protein
MAGIGLDLADAVAAALAERLDASDEFADLRLAAFNAGHLPFAAGFARGRSLNRAGQDEVTAPEARQSVADGVAQIAAVAQQRASARVQARQQLQPVVLGQVRGGQQGRSDPGMVFGKEEQQARRNRPPGERGRNLLARAEIDLLAMPGEERIRALHLLAGHGIEALGEEIDQLAPLGDQGGRVRAGKRHHRRDPVVEAHAYPSLAGADSSVVEPLCAIVKRAVVGAEGCKSGSCVMGRRSGHFCCPSGRLARQKGAPDRPAPLLLYSRCGSAALVHPEHPEAGQVRPRPRDRLERGLGTRLVAGLPQRHAEPGVGEAGIDAALLEGEPIESAALV